MYGAEPAMEPVGYSIEPVGAVTVSLDRKRYPEFTDAETRLADVLRMRSLRVVGVPFYTARHWCWRCVDA